VEIEFGLHEDVQGLLLLAVAQLGAGLVEGLHQALDASVDIAANLSLAEVAVGAGPLAGDPEAPLP
jgi:hypothetical protein